jgi:peptidyl-prolyl cis-trans isomerase A (cyclophilin A)
MKAFSLIAPLVLVLVLMTGFLGGEASAESALPNEQAPAQFRVKFETTRGPVVIEVNRAWAPLGADRFYNLVKSGYFDNAAFFRVIPGFVVQFGINGDPEVSGKWQKANIKDDPVKESNHRGYLTFATAGPNTRTTQMFINLANNANLDRMGFAPIGRVVEGMKVIDSLYSGYGEGAPAGRGPSQDRIYAKGNAYLKDGFPKLDYITKAELESQPEK